MRFWSIAVLCLSLCACGTASQPTVQKPGRNALVLENIVLTEANRQGNAQIWELKAARAEYNRDQSVASIEQVKGVFFQDGKKALTVEAPRGEVRIATREILLMGGVKGVSPVRQTQLNASQVQWFPDKARLEASGSIVLSQPKEKLQVRAERLEGDLGLQVYTLSGNVRVDSEANRLKIETPRLVWSLKPNRVSGSEGVVARSLERGVSLKAPRASWEIGSDLITAEAGAGQAVIGEQKSPAARLTANRMTWNLGTQIFEGEGNVQGRMGEPELRFEASRAIYALASRQLRAERARYQQSAQNFSLESPELFADLQNNTVSAGGGRVTTRFEPKGAFQ